MLETKISELTAAILELTNVMKGCATEMKEDAATIIATVEKQVVQEVVQEVVNKQRDHDDLRALILTANRATPDNKPKMKAILESFNAKKVTDVKESDIESACVAVEKVTA
jgi:hypothetical protein